MTTTTNPLENHSSRSLACVWRPTGMWMQETFQSPTNHSQQKHKNENLQICPTS